jgi:hypothetical protein
MNQFFVMLKFQGTGVAKAAASIRLGNSTILSRNPKTHTMNIHLQMLPYNKARQLYKNTPQGQVFQRTILPMAKK